MLKSQPANVATKIDRTNSTKVMSMVEKDFLASEHEILINCPNHLTGKDAHNLLLQTSTCTSNIARKIAYSTGVKTAPYSTDSIVKPSPNTQMAQSDRSLDLFPGAST